jgi:2',3'-cyclic-nucleotide 2'-phosphodiesterase (5'-nucleotidase family)
MKGIRRIFIISFLLVFTISCKEGIKEFAFSGYTILLNPENNLTKDSLIEDLIHHYRHDLEADMNRVLVYSDHVMEKGTPEGPLNNFVADLVLYKGQKIYIPQDEKPIDFCLLNYGGLRVPLPDGEITYSRVYELLPFENEMVVITLSGEKTYELFRYLSAATVGMPISGARLTIKDNQPIEITIHDQAFDINRNYKVLTSDYLAGGGDSMEFFLQSINYELLGIRVRDAIIEHMQNMHRRGEKISAANDGRIRIIK